MRIGYNEFVDIADDEMERSALEYENYIRGCKKCCVCGEVIFEDDNDWNSITLKGETLYFHMSCCDEG